MDKYYFTFKPVQQSQRLLIHNRIIQDHIKEWLHYQMELYMNELLKTNISHTTDILDISRE